MSESEGFIKIYRSFIKWEWYTDINTKTVFLHCLLSANWQDGRFQGVAIPRGSFVASYPKIAKDTGLSIQSVRTAIKHLKSTGELTGYSTSKFSVITVVKYDEYQDANRQSNRHPTGDQQASNNNRRNKEKKERKNIYSASNRFNNFEQRKINFKELEV